MGLTDIFGRRSSLESIALIALAQKSAPYDSPRWGDTVGRRASIDGDSGEINSYSGLLPWVSVAVDAITRDVASQEFYFTDLDGKIIETRRVQDEIKIPFELGYEGLSFVQMLKYIVPIRLLSGNAYLWRIVGTMWGASRGVEDSFMPLNSTEVKICFKPNKKGISYYEVTLADSRFIVEPDDMIHIRQNSILNPFIGIGNIAKMRLIAEGDIAATEYLNSFLVDSMQMPLNIVIEKGAREGADMQRYQSMLKAKYSKRMGYLNGEDISIVQSSLLQKDFDFIGIQAGGRQVQLSVFGVPPIVAGIPDDSNKATSGNQFAGYYGSTINPILRELADEFTRQHVWRFDKSIKMQFKLHPSADILAVKDMLQNGIISPNRAAELMGEEFDLADDTRNAYYFPSNYLPIGYIPPDPVVQTQASPAAPVQEAGKMLADPKNVKDIVDYFVKNSLKNKHFQRFYISASLKSRNQVEAKYIEKISDYFRQSESRVLEKLAAFGSKSIKEAVVNLDLADIINLEEEKLALIDEITPLHTSALQRGINDINQIKGSRVNLALSNPFVKAAIYKLGTRITGTVPQTTIDSLQKIITKAVDESWNINKVQDAISGQFDQFQGYRARMIARTESRLAWDAAAQVAYNEIGVNAVDVVGCTMLESDSDCGRKNIPISEIGSLVYHPNHIGCLAPVEE